MKTNKETFDSDSKEYRRYMNIVYNFKNNYSKERLVEIRLSIDIYQDFCWLYLCDRK